MSSVGAFSLRHPVIFTLTSLVFTLEDPNLAIPPGYSSNDFDKEQEPFVNAGLTPLQAANTLWN
jgi:hypothetical protein